jgi:hypothetical protein
MNDGLIQIGPPFYVIHAMTSFWRCGWGMPAIAFVAPNVPEADGEICILSEVEKLPEVVLSFMRKRFPLFQLKYSKTSGLRYYANTCPKCGVISGNFHLHSEPGAPFFPTTKGEAKRLTLDLVPLTGSIEVRAGIGTGAGDLILKQGRKATGK